MKRQKLSDKYQAEPVTKLAWERGAAAYKMQQYLQSPEGTRSAKRAYTTTNI